MAFLIIMVGVTIILSLRLPGEKPEHAILKIDFQKIPKGKFGDEVRYGLDLMLNTATLYRARRY